MASLGTSPKIDSIEKVVIIVDLMVGVVPTWAERRDDLPMLVDALTGMGIDKAKEAIKTAEEKKLIKYFNPFNDEQNQNPID